MPITFPVNPARANAVQVFRVVEEHAVAVIAAQERPSVIGRHLAEARETLSRHGNGTYGRWCRERLGLSRSRAHRYVRVHEVYGRTFEVRPKLERSYQPSALYALTEPSTPEPAREEAARLADAGEYVTRAKALAIVARHRRKFDDEGGDAGRDARIEAVLRKVKRKLGELSDPEVEAAERLIDDVLHHAEERIVDRVDDLLHLPDVTPPPHRDEAISIAVATETAFASHPRRAVYSERERERERRHVEVRSRGKRTVFEGGETTVAERDAVNERRARDAVAAESERWAQYRDTPLHDYNRERGQHR